jgi:predicted RNA-binding protein with PUA-like domain
VAAQRQYWLIKSEPDVFSIADLKRDKTTHWEGVRNYQARNHLAAMKKGDWALFYHSNADPPAAAGIAKVSREAYPDDAQFDPKSDYYDPKSDRSKPRWVRVDVAFVEQFKEPVSLATLKDDPELEGMLVIKKGMRLSVQPVTEAHFFHVCALGGSKRTAKD